MKFNFENAKKVVKNTAIGVAATFGVMNGNVQAEQTPKDTNQTTIKTSISDSIETQGETTATYTEALDSARIAQIQDLTRKLNETKGTLTSAEQTYGSLYQKVLSTIKGKDVKNFETVKDLPMQIKSFIDYYISVRPNADLGDEKIQAAILKDIADLENPYTGTKYALVMQGVNQQVGDNILRVGQSTTEDRSTREGIKIAMDQIVKEYAKQKSLEKQLAQLGQ